MSAVEVTTAKVYRVGGKGKAWLSKTGAYRSAAIHRVIDACVKRHDSLAEAMDSDHGAPRRCKYCRRTCDGSRRVRHVAYRYDYYVQEEGCENDPTHSYRYRLVARLARWLRWRDEREAEIAAAELESHRVWSERGYAQLAAQAKGGGR